MGNVNDSHVEGSVPKPKEHIFLVDRAVWWDLPENDGLERHSEFNEPFQARLRAWRAEGCPRRTDVSESLYRD